MNTLLAARRLVVARGAVSLLDGIDLEVRQGDVVAIIGPSGAGKSTLARSLLGLMAPTAGRVEIDGRPLSALGARGRAEYLAWLPQLAAATEAIAVIEFLAAARFRFDESWAMSRAGARGALRACAIERLAEQPVDSLSGGELQRVALAGLIAQDSRIFVLDEPSNHLDPRRQREIYRLLGDQWRAGRTLVIITHDINLLSELGAAANDLAPRVVGMRGGQLVFQRRFGEQQLAADLEELFELPYAWVPVGNRRLLLPGEGP